MSTSVLSWWPWAIALANTVVCLALAWACICRLNKASERTTQRVFVWKYAVLLTAAVASAISPVFGIVASPIDLILNAAFFFALAGGRRAWRDGVPEYARTDAGRVLAELERQHVHGGHS